MITVGTPILKLDVCSESKALYTCTVNESTTLLYWDIDFLSGHYGIDRILYESTNQVGTKVLASNRGTGVVYEFNLTSQSPLTSTMTTNMSTDLSGATVSCSNGFQMSADVAMLVLNSMYEYPWL